MDMFSTRGGIETVLGVLLCSQITLALWTWLLARRVQRLSWLVSRATKRAQAPQMWESKLAETQADLVSLSSSFEKVTKAVTRQNAREEMRARRGSATSGPPPRDASKAEKLRYYGLLGKSGPEFARAQQQLELQSTQTEQ